VNRKTAGFEDHCILFVTGWKWNYDKKWPFLGLLQTGSGKTGSLPFFRAWID
jgi:hypothetical protein